MFIPKLAIIDPNTLAIIGMRQLLTSAMPMMQVDGFNTLDELMESHPEQYAHYFVQQGMVLANRNFFMENKHKTIVLTTQTDPTTYLQGFRNLCVNQPEKALVRSILHLEQQGHPGGKNLPFQPSAADKPVLSDREIEVLVLIAQGKINKEIADRLNISITTVISHRKNITDKLGIKTVSALTIYAVMHGYLDIKSI